MELFKRRRIEAHIDMTPMIDVVFQLLAFFLLTFQVPVAEGDAPAIAPHLGAGTVVMSLQNGVDNAQRLARALQREVIPAVVYVATAMPRRRLNHSEVSATSGAKLAELPSRPISSPCAIVKPSTPLDSPHAR